MNGNVGRIFNVKSLILILITLGLCLSFTTFVFAEEATKTTTEQAEALETAVAAAMAKQELKIAETTLTVFWLTAVFITIFLVVVMLAIVKGLMSSESWSLADAVSEEADLQPANPAPGVKPIMVASSSRLIALLGLVVILALFLGSGYYMLWKLFTTNEIGKLDEVASYFYSGLVLFAPYLVNKFSGVFNVFKPGNK